MPAKRSPLSHRISSFDLELFVAVVKAGSITLGSREMHLSLAAASSRLQKVEHTLGATLLHRSKLGVTPTDAGRTLLQHAGRLEREFENLHAEMAAFTRGARRSIRVLCNTAAMTEYLPPLIGEFLSKHADVDIDLRELGSVDVLQAMHQERADIGIVADYVDTEGLKTRIFRDDPLVVVHPIAMELSRGSKVQFSALLTKPFVGLPADSAFSRFLQNQAMRHGRGPHYRVRVRSFETVINLIKSGVGIAVVPETTARRLATPKIGVKSLADTWANRKLLICTPIETVPHKSAADLVDFLLAQKKSMI